MLRTVFKNFSFIATIFIFVAATVGMFSVEAAPNKKTSYKKKIPLPVQTSMVVDGKSGKILHAHNAHKVIYPASLAKLMTAYLLFENLESGKFTLNDNLYVSKHATRAKPSKLHLKHKEYIKVRDAILALNVKSANDVAIVIAENVAGSEKKFATLMTKRAHQLGMKSTNFTNASGWHNSKQVTTASDLAKLSIAIKRDFPQYYHFFKRNGFKYKGHYIAGHNKITKTYPGAEGLKTGFHIPAGYNIITTASRNNKNIVGIVTGSPNAAGRDKKIVRLLDKYLGVKHKTIKRTKKSKKSNAVKKQLA
ncbi:D-alanyl-D-alanine carboxypeptidase [Rickettsiaceae bacterium]|nr:D-alanyl-D-alanine carboxypeptidase [Rickettsiaceae bacterium]